MMSRSLVLALVSILCLPRLAAGLACPANPDTENRAVFIEAERSPPRSDDEWKRLRGRLGDYPLFPYVELARLRSDFPDVATSKVEAFMKRYDEDPVTLHLKRRWLRRLANRGAWRKFIKWYPANAPVDLRCLHARALLATGEESGAFEEAQILWMSGKSRPKACDPIFARWLESKRFSASLAWERIGLAMARGNPRLARYLERFLDSSDRKLAAAWRAVHKNPGRVGTIKLDGEPSQVEAILVHGLVRLAGRDPTAAARALARVASRYELGVPSRAAVVRRIGLSYASRHEPQAIDWLWRADSAHADEHVLRWRVAAAVLHSRWNRVLEGIASMPGEERDRERWRYWRAHALEASGSVDEARAEFESLARARDYYGFLSADRLNAEYHFNHRPVSVDEQVVERVVAMPGMRRALELFALDRRVDARREWHHLTRTLGEEELKAASWIAQCSGWHGRAILTIVRTPDRDDLELRFPIDFQQAVETSARRRSLSPATVYAFIRQESAFMPDARSSRDARGLMQILPRTGRLLMRARGKRLRRSSQLFAPELNVELGTQYIRSLLSKTGGNIVLAAASYNAGPHRVRSWLPEKGDVEAPVWIDNIPFTETRRYVRRILAYSAIYEHHLGQRPTRLTERLQPVPSRIDR